MGRIRPPPRGIRDVEGSTRLLHEVGAESYAKALAEHRRVLREAFAPMKPDEIVKFCERE
jgi:hypothetical protein